MPSPFLSLVDLCYCVQMKIVLGLRKRQLANRAELQKGNSCRCFAYAQVHASGSGFQWCLRAPSLGPAVGPRESFPRQSSFCCRTEGCFSELTAVSIVLTMLHVPC